MSEAPTHKESDDAYLGVVVRLNDRWRVIVCRNGIQWILQTAKKRRDGTAWEGRSYCRTREGLNRCVSRLAGRISAGSEAVLAGLPDMAEASPRATPNR